MSLDDFVGGTGGGSHLISKPFAPLNHLGDGVSVLVLARFSNGIHNSKIAL